MPYSIPVLLQLPLVQLEEALMQNQALVKDVLEYTRKHQSAVGAQPSTATTTTASVAQSSPFVASNVSSQPPDLTPEPTTTPTATTANNSLMELLLSLDARVSASQASASSSSSALSTHHQRPQNRQQPLQQQQLSVSGEKSEYLAEGDLEEEVTTIKEDETEEVRSQFTAEQNQMTMDGY
jgi:hypothetical protein